MTRPDSGSPDQSANQDDAVWLDLVARLEGKSPDLSSTRDEGMRDEGTAPSAVTDHFDADKPGAATDGPGETPGRTAAFRDFDPLGLAGRAPTELSAAERLTAAPVASGGGQSGVGGEAAGPRDYGVEDDGGDFVPEEPPSLSGTDPLTMLAWFGAVGAPLALVLSVMFWRSAPLLAIVGIVAAFILAVVYLIMKLPQEKDENDDGARV